ncbi:Lrp/AsnC family transcriptional regulator [Cohaesibacter haloalkalitolerans]|uniref:Lrp/AsnC family transcriptional regulator n=1 Tax=Cohaesibacter haloalkalitolerans TaxID=1162980 RepID=UPI000E6592A9|nr:winged helix-turn-helix transcriptional regulator [Cohaesibacter haloalkalitolerans]
MPRKSSKLDRIDLHILDELQKNARITNKALSEIVGLSPSPCLQRVKRLEDIGLISGYLGLINLEALCRHVTVVATITIRDHDHSIFSTFEKAIAELPDVVECLKMSGSFDYLVRFVCTDIQRYHSVTEDLLVQVGGKMQIASHVVLDQTKQYHGVDLEGLVHG